MRCYVDMLLITSTANIKTWERDNGLYGGLSPLARGTRVCQAPLRIYSRFIPAGAGNSNSATSSSILQTVYPRWRGELDYKYIVSTGVIGLSPLARGTPAFTDGHKVRKRFIPAGAGNSRSSSNIVSQLTGLSPLARGTLTLLMNRVPKPRFIPAGAGNSTVHFITGRLQPVYPRWRGELSKHNLLLINDFLSQSQSTNFTVSHKQHIHYVKERLIHWLKR